MTNVDPLLRDLMRPPDGVRPRIGPEALRAAEPRGGLRPASAVMAAVIGCLAVIASTGIDPSQILPGGDPGTQGPFLQYSEMQTKPMALVARGERLIETNGCLEVDGMPILWPPDASWDGRAVELERDGMRIRIEVGGRFPSNGLAGGALPLREVDDVADEGIRKVVESCLVEQAATSSVGSVVTIN